MYTESAAVYYCEVRCYPAVRIGHTVRGLVHPSVRLSFRLFDPYRLLFENEESAEK